VENTISGLEAKATASGESMPLPFMTLGGTLVIPFESSERYHWWKGGQSVALTLQEVKERMNYVITV
jgi:hypothetical protein